MPRLIHGDVVQEFSKVNDDLEKQTVVNVLAEAFGKCAFEADAALRYKRLLESIQSQQADWTARACLCIISFLEAEGILPYVDGCVQCGSTAGIETFSKEKAGFLCGKCSHGRKVWPVIQLRKFRALCKAGVQDDEKLVAAYSFTLKDFVFLADWLMRHAQVRLAGLEFLETVLRLS
jgi:DNA repair protein RecO (recombination protein O)